MHLKFTFAILAIILFSCSSNDRKEHPLPVNGVLDLHDWNFEREGNIQAKGYWEFCYGEFLTAEGFDSLTTKHYSWVPGVWKKEYYTADPSDIIKLNQSEYPMKVPWKTYYWNNEPLGATGYASYRLRIIPPVHGKSIAFRIKDQGTAYRFFINDSLSAFAGVTGSTEITSKPSLQHKSVVYNGPADTLNVILWISNFHYRKGGFWKTITISNPEIMEKNLVSKDYILIFILGIWFMVVFAQYIFYIYRPKEKYNLFILLWALCIVIRMPTADDRLILSFLPHFPFELLIKLELLSGFGMVPFFLMSMKYLYPAEFSARVIHVIMWSYLIYLVLVIATKSLVYSYLTIPWQILSIAGLIFSLILLTSAVKLRRPGAVIIGSGMILVVTMYLLQIAYYNNLLILQWGASTSAIGLIVAFVLITLLARTFSSAMGKVENFASEMEATVEARTHELVETQKKLIVVAKQTETERIRRRISQDIHDDVSSGLNKISWMGELAKIKAMRKKPEELNITIDKIIKSSRETVDNLIEIIWSLNPNNDDLESLLVYMRNYINKFFDDTSFNVTIKFPEHPPPMELNPELKRNLFLIMKEALNNAAKYSGAQNIVVDFIYTGHEYIYKISDDGIGIDGKIIKGTGNGMINMRKRMESVNGSFEVLSSKGQGTIVVLKGQLY